MHRQTKTTTTMNQVTIYQTMGNITTVVGDYTFNEADIIMNGYAHILSCLCKINRHFVLFTELDSLTLYNKVTDTVDIEYRVELIVR